MLIFTETSIHILYLRGRNFNAYNRFASYGTFCLLNACMKQTITECRHRF